MIEVLAETENRGDIRDKLTMVAQAARELLDYCNDIIDFARVDYGVQPVFSQPFDLKKLLYAIMRMQTPAANTKKIQFTLTVGKNVPAVVLSDLYRLKRILINLISNAIKFTRKGYVKVSAHVEKKSNTKNEKILRLTIEDSGIGIPGEKTDFIYEKFARITPSNKGLYKGSGLGLRIVKQFIEEMGGNIYVTSEVNQGTIFRVLLPVATPLSSNIIKE
jgi:signal transduction histidine kinase